MDKKRQALLLQFVLHRSAFILCLALLCAGCGARRTPDLSRIFAATRARPNKPPVIVIPGVLGSQIVNAQTGEVVWPSAFRTSGDGLSLPTTPDLAANRDALVASKIVLTARLVPRIPADVYVYYELINALKTYGGYREGDWDHPTADGDHDTFYVFPYDWRRDNVETARLLVRQVEALKLKLNRPDLRFNLVAHSMGGLVARYAAMYGDADLSADDAPPQVSWAGARDINKIFMFGTPNEGSADAFATLLDGYSVTEGLRRRVRLLNKLSREDAFTIPSIFQLLPHGHAARFLDADLAPLDLDLYDSAVWREHGWSPAHDPALRERRTRGHTDNKDEPRLSGNARTDLDGYLAAVLLRAKRFHEALDADIGIAPPPVLLFAFGGDCEETLAAPVLIRDPKTQRWQTYTAPRAFTTAAGRRVARSEVTRAMYEPGDGRVTRRSLLGETISARRNLSLFDTSLPIAYAVFACDLHGDLQNNKTLQDNALTVLVSEALK